VKVGSIHNRADIVSKLDESMPPVPLLLVIPGAKCYVMDRTGRYTPWGAIGSAQQIDNSTDSTFARGREPKTIARLLHQPIAEGFGQ